MAGRGSEYERQIAAFMRAQGYHCKLRTKKRGATGVRPHEVDVHAAFHSKTWDRLSTAALALLCIGVIVVGLAAIDSDARATFLEADAGLGAIAGGGFAPGLAAMGLALVLGALAFIGAHRQERHVWIECKDRNRPVKRDAVIKLAEQVSEVRKAGHGWQPTEVWIASSSGFDQDAEAFAAKHGIRCATIVKGPS